MKTITSDDESKSNRSMIEPTWTGRNFKDSTILLTCERADALSSCFHSQWKQSYQCNTETLYTYGFSQHQCYVVHQLEPFIHKCKHTGNRIWRGSLSIIAFREDEYNSNCSLETIKVTDYGENLRYCTSKKVGSLMNIEKTKYRKCIIHELHGSFFNKGIVNKWPRGTS